MNRMLLCMGVTVLLGGCGASSRHSSTTSAQSRTATTPLLVRIQVSSPAFTPGGPIPRRYTCDGADVSLPLRWAGLPADTRELTLVMRDPDAPGGNFIHWSLTGIPSNTSGLPAGSVPAGVVQGRNGFGTTGYRGPCPPRGDRAHHYEITLTAFGGAGGQKLGSGTLTGTYARR
jgi:Raf kinase inhibitor-like YbhB/YbcL family protein